MSLLVLISKKINVYKANIVRDPLKEEAGKWRRIFLLKAAAFAEKTKEESDGQNGKQSSSFPELEVHIQALRT